MLPDLERLIRLQELDVETDHRRKWTADLPVLLAALDQRVADAEAALEAARQRHAENLAARRALEKDLAVVQSRLTRFKDQLMEVKTNKEYLAMQHEIAMAEDGVRGFEDQILELLVAADEIVADVKADETALQQQKQAVAAERAATEDKRQRTEAELAQLGVQRAGVERDMPGELVLLYTTVALKRRGTAVVAVRDGYCSACHTHLRPQFYNDIRRGDHVYQCESCSRILYYPPASQPTPAAS
jgi:predicted  nucleic acid-binding Zn-ribbon protein